MRTDVSIHISRVSSMLGASYEGIKSTCMLDSLYINIGTAFLVILKSKEFKKKRTKLYHNPSNKDKEIISNPDIEIITAI